MKVFRFYFLALLLICALPVFAQEAPAEAAQQNEAVTDGQSEAPAEEPAKAEEPAQPKEEAPAEESAQPKEEAPAEEPAQPKEEAPAEEGQSDLEAELAAQADDKSESDELAKAEDEKKAEKQSSFTIGINNTLSHGFAKERKSFGYTLNVFASYSFPLQFALSADLGLRESYRYGMSEAVATEAGMESSSDLDYSKFDGTPLNIGLSKGFGFGTGVMGSIGIGVSVPCTSKELWDVYEVRTILGVNLGLAKNFQLPKEVFLGLSFGFNYAKTFAEYDAAWDKYSNEPLGYLQNHDIGLSLSLGINYKGFGFKLSGGYNFGSDYKLDTKDYYYDGFKGSIKDSEWYYLFSFGATASYSIKGFVFALGVRTNAPEFDNGNYEGFTELPGDPDVKNGSTNYPFKAKYTTVFANIGYSYSF
ncbi:hypothetical protein J6Z19_06865 [bacterium]|nr:hypothetical protein [bacterium]